MLFQGVLDSLCPTPRGRTERMKIDVCRENGHGRRRGVFRVAYCVRPSDGGTVGWRIRLGPAKRQGGRKIVTFCPGNWNFVRLCPPLPALSAFARLFWGGGEPEVSEYRGAGVSAGEREAPPFAAFRRLAGGGGYHLASWDIDESAQDQTPRKTA